MVFIPNDRFPKALKEETETGIKMGRSGMEKGKLYSFNIDLILFLI